jgi:hypothetical protein
MKKIIILLALSLGACGPGADIGKRCDTSVCGVNNPPDNANTICEPASGCDTLLCVAQGSGLGTGSVTMFCSAVCVEESDCPEGFSCLEVAAIGENANKKMCLH